MISEWASMSTLPEGCRVLSTTDDYLQWHRDRVDAEQEFQGLIQLESANISGESANTHSSRFILAFLLTYLLHSVV